MSLDTLIKKRIEKSGPMSVADYMALVLSHPEHGYYMRKDPLGAAGDFTTSPEISQIFGELIGLWLAEQWRAMGKPKAALVELGPGRGTLMADILRATRMISRFHESVSVHLVETSGVLKQAQWNALAGKHPDLNWHTDIDELPEKPFLLVANEFFDALPISQFVCENGEWKERMVGIEDGKLCFVYEAAKPPAALASVSAKAGTIYEYSEAAENIIHSIAGHVVAHGGSALVVDYGYAGGTRGDTLQALKAHSYHEVLITPGEADLTAHVDFDRLKAIAQKAGAAVYGPRPQGAFLGSLGAIARAVRLCENTPDNQQAEIMAGLTRLVSPEAMGELFKVLAITTPDRPAPEGF